MLKEVRLKNFKLHEDTTIEVAPITVFIGPNNSGKSSIFQALLALKQATRNTGNNTGFLQTTPPERRVKEDPYVLPGLESVDLGSFEDILRQGDKGIEIGVTGDVQPPKDLRYGVPLQVGFDLTIRGNALTYNHGRLESGYGTVDWSWLAGPTAHPSQQAVAVQGLSLLFVGANSFRLLEPRGIQSNAGSSPPPELVQDLNELSWFFAGAPAKLLDSVHPVLPLRGFEEWGYPLPDHPPASLEKLILRDRATALAATLQYDRDLEEDLSETLEELIGVKLKVRLIPGRRVTLRASEAPSAGNGAPSQKLLSNEGMGANQLPFILVPMALASPNETILLSEPEVHLHPALQSKLVSMLLTLALKRSLQLIVETHSEHVLHKLLHAVAKADLPKEDLAIYYFENQQGTAKVTKLEVNDQGQVSDGLPGFYDQSLAELSEYLDALKKA
ncbi:MAG TPA: DUF3696 domain-containing protein [Terriglobia bacterium]|nr:DUF3696 domain-containing protein [Terriglobia bacterium]